MTTLGSSYLGPPNPLSAKTPTGPPTGPPAPLVVKPPTGPPTELHTPRRQIKCHDCGDNHHRRDV